MSAKVLDFARAKAESDRRKALKRLLLTLRELELDEGIDADRLETFRWQAMTTGYPIRVPLYEPIGRDARGEVPFREILSLPMVICHPKGEFYVEVR